MGGVIRRWWSGSDGRYPTSRVVLVLASVGSWPMAALHGQSPTGQDWPGTACPLSGTRSGEADLRSASCGDSYSIPQVSWDIRSYMRGGGFDAWSLFDRLTRTGAGGG